MSSKASTTIGFERRFNHALLEDHDEFLAAAAGPQPPRPPNMVEIVELNRGPFVGAASPLVRVVKALEGAALLDVRPAREFGGGHRPGAVNVPVSGSSFGTKAAFVVPEGPIVIEAADEEQAMRAADALHSVGILELGGWREAGGDELLEPVGLDELERRLATGEIDVIDVREADEADGGSIPGSRNVPYRLIREATGGGLPIVTVCESGARAAIAASVLQAAGADARPVLDGGVAEWRSRHGAVA
jgi:hydroxyacylglutathione hydrolase